MGCCHIDQASGKLMIQEIALKEGTYHVRGNYDRTPETLSDRIDRWFQRSELMEKMAETVDESFHVGKEILKLYTTSELYQTFRDLHQAAHSVEHVLHAFCFLGDVSRIITGKFFEYEGKENRHLNYLRSAARVCHTVGHFLTTAAFLSSLKLCQFGRLERVFKYATAFSALGYGMWTISLIWQRQLGLKNKNFMSDMGINLGGCLFEALPLTTTLASLVSYTQMINKVSSLAGIIHAWCLVQRLMPNDHEKCTGSFVIPTHISTPDDASAHSHRHGHHDDGLTWFSLKQRSI